MVFCSVAMGAEACSVNAFHHAAELHQLLAYQGENECSKDKFVSHLALLVL